MILVVFDAVVMKASEACSVKAAGLGVHVCRRGLVLSMLVFLLVRCVRVCVFNVNSLYLKIGSGEVSAHYLFSL